MKRYYFLVILFALAFLQTTIIPLNLLLLALSAWAFCRSFRELIIFAWISGLLLDLLSNTPLGLSAFFFLVFVAILFSLRQRFIHTAFEPSLKAVAPLLFLAVFLGEVIWEVFFSFATSSPLSFPWVNILIGVLLTLAFFPVISYISLRWQETEQLELRF